MSEVKVFDTMPDGHNLNNVQCETSRCFIKTMER
jgi:hypothetical protein